MSKEMAIKQLFNTKKGRKVRHYNKTPEKEVEKKY